MEITPDHSSENLVHLTRAQQDVAVLASKFGNQTIAALFMTRGSQQDLSRWANPSVPERQIGIDGVLELLTALKDKQEGRLPDVFVLRHLAAALGLRLVQADMQAGDMAALNTILTETTKEFAQLFTKVSEAQADDGVVSAKEAIDLDLPEKVNALLGAVVHLQQAVTQLVGPRMKALYGTGDHPHPSKRKG